MSHRLDILPLIYNPHMKMKPLSQLVMDIDSCPFNDLDGTCHIELEDCVGLDNEECPLEKYSGVWVQKAYKDTSDCEDDRVKR